MDKRIATTDAVDEERKMKVQEIKLESNIYNAFRNILRIVLNRATARDQKDEIMKILSNVTIPYHTKLGVIDNMLRDIMNPFVAFIDYGKLGASGLDKILRCIGEKEATCNDRKYCMYKKDEGKCVLLASQVNLISGGDNSQIYFGRLADELIRYSRIRTFILNPQTFLSFQQMSYNLKEDEIILLEELLYGNYFEDIVPEQRNPFIRSRAIYDIAEPSQSVPYKSTFTLNKMSKTDIVSSCLVTNPAKKKLKFGYWQTRGLGDAYMILEYEHSYECSWEVVLTVIRSYTHPKASLEDLRRVLVDAFRSLIKRGNMDSIVAILGREGKKLQANDIRNTGPNDTITIDNYPLTLFDLYLLFDHYKCPTIVMSRTSIPSLNSKQVAFIPDGAGIDSVYIIFGAKWNPREANISERVPIYGIVQRDGISKLSVAQFAEDFAGMTKVRVTTFAEYSKMSAILRVKKPGKIKITIGKATKA